MFVQQGSKFVLTDARFIKIDNKFERRCNQMDDKFKVLYREFAHVEAKIDTKIYTIY